jgi:hypothetical protein
MRQMVSHWRIFLKKFFEAIRMRNYLSHVWSKFYVKKKTTKEFL